MSDDGGYGVQVHQPRWDREIPRSDKEFTIQCADCGKVYKITRSRRSK